MGSLKLRIIKQMSRNTVISAILMSVGLISILSVSHHNFSKYRPIKTYESPKVRGVKTDEFPYPQDAEKVGSSTTKASGQITFKTSQTQQELINFYKDFYENKNWKTALEEVKGTNASIVFKKNNESINVFMTKEEVLDNTLVSIEKITN